MLRLTKRRVLIIPNGMALAAAALLVWGSAQRPIPELANGDCISFGVLEGAVAHQTVSRQYPEYLAIRPDAQQESVNHDLNTPDSRQAPVCTTANGAESFGAADSGSGNSFLNLSLLYLPARALLGN